jgi:hypothetical protein
MYAYPVSRYVNSPSNDDAAALAPAPPDTSAAADA